MVMHIACGAAVSTIEADEPVAAAASGYSAKRTQFEGAGVEAIDKIFVRRLGIVGGLDWGRVLTARETSAPSLPAPPKIAPPMPWDEAADGNYSPLST